MAVFKEFLKNNCPHLVNVWHVIKQEVPSISKRISESFLIFETPFLQKKALRKLKDKDILKCVFLVAEVADWKCDRVYNLMLESPRFDPVIIICPVINYGEKNKIEEIQECIEFFQNKKYSFLVAYQEDTKSLLDIKSVINPDLIFYTDPYRNLTEDEYYITNYRSVLGLYIPYGFNNNSEFNHSYNLLFHNLLWRLYVESDAHRDFAVSVSRCEGRNVVASGYPAIEGLIDGHKPSFESWKDGNSSLKRIIWAPHHTIEPVGNFAYSCFLEYADFMLEMAEKYNNAAQFVFRPHPHLRKKLNLLWGKERTDEYYLKWASMDNTSFVEGGYEDLFLTSDAMIHDSGSFTIEYLFVNKPVLRTINDIPLDRQYNSFTLKCLEQYYLSSTHQGVEQFIENVISGTDPMKEQRTRFVNEVLMPDIMPSRKIVEDILDSIDNQILYRK